MKPQDFMDALGGISQERLDALAKWQNAKMPITGEAPAKGERITQTAAEPVSAARRRGTMKQKVKTKAPATQILPWKFGIGATVVACAVIAVSIGGGIISLDKQMQVGSNVGTSMSEQIAENTADEVKATITVQHEPVEIIDKLVVSGGNDSTMMKLPPEGAVQVLRNVEDAEACCQYSSENVADEPFDFRKKLTEDVFAQYDVLYFGFKDEQQPQNCYSVDLAGGSIAEDGTTLKLNFHALMFDPEYLPAHWCSTTEPDWNTYYFYTVPKDSLPDLYAIELSFEEYPIGEIPDEILAHANDLVDIEDNGYITMHTKLQEYLETSQEYLDWILSMPKPKYITWENSTLNADMAQEAFSSDGLIYKSDCRSTGDGPVQIIGSVHADDPDGRVIWKNNEGDTTIAFTYEIDMSKADTAKFVRYHAEQLADDTEPMQIQFTCELTKPDGQPLYIAHELVSDSGTLIEPADEPYLLTMHIQPLRGNGCGLGFSEFTLNTIMTVSDSMDGEPSQSFTFSNRVFKDTEFRHDGAFTWGYGIFDTDDCTKPQLETIRYGESDCMLYLCTQLTGHETAKGNTYNVLVKIHQDSDDSTTPVLFSLTPDGQKQDGIWLNDLRQGDYNQMLTALYPELRTDLAESEITLELWYQPDVIPPESRYYCITGNDSVEYFQHTSITLKAEYTVAETN